jgi:hypothetical protein
VPGEIYSFIITKFYSQKVVWQDDPATIHRTEAALEDSSAFASRIPNKEQAPKMADIWPVENIWSIEMVKPKEPRNKAQPKTIIPRVWREIKSDKELCKMLNQSIPPGLKL